MRRKNYFFQVLEKKNANKSILGGGKKPRFLGTVGERGERHRTSNYIGAE